jgi:chorismate synthase
MAFAHQTGIFMILSERETNKSGYTDIAMLVRPNNPSEHAEFVFELKYLKKEEKKHLKKAQKEAKKQLQNYLEGDEMLKNRKNLSAYTVCVVKDEVFLEKI